MEETETLIVTPGRYRMRLGRTAIIESTSKRDARGRIEGLGVALTWHADGRIMRDVETDFDLVTRIGD